MTDPNVDELPEVSASTNGTVVLELAPHHAEVLAKILAHYDVLVTAPGSTGVAADGYEPEVWHHTLIRLLAERTRTDGVLGQLLVLAGGAR